MADVLWIDLEECIRAVDAGTLENCIAIEELQMVQRAALKTIGRANSC